MRVRLSQYLRLIALSFAAVCAVVLNYRHVAVVQHVVAPGTTPLALSVGKRAIVVRERVSLESVYADAVTVAGPEVAWLPLPDPIRNPLGAWLQARLPALATLPARVARIIAVRAVPSVARLLGASVAPQAP